MLELYRVNTSREIFLNFAVAVLRFLGQTSHVVNYLVPDLGHCAHSLSLLSFLFLLTALWTCVKHLTSQKNSARKPVIPVIPPPLSYNNC